MYDVMAKVVSQKGTCSAGHTVGDEFVIGQKSPGQLCSFALYTLFPFATVLQTEGTFPWEKDPDTAFIACPDPENPVVFELRRLRK